MNGLIVVDKPPSLSSHDVVRRVRTVARTRRVGHLGTLDPFATGVLPLVLGRATRLARFLSREERVYETVVRFGQATDTGDPTGQPTGAGKPVPEESQIRKTLKQFQGKIRQRPPAFSAKKIGGQRAYRLARRGERVEVEPVWVTIHRFELLGAESEVDFRFRVACSTGTYIRTLASDLAERLDSAAHVLSLKRLRCGSFHLDQAVPLEQLKTADDAESHLVPLEGLPLGLASLTLSEDASRRFAHGLAVEASAPACEDTGRRVLAPDGRLLGVGSLELHGDDQTWRLLPRVVLAGD